MTPAKSIPVGARGALCQQALASRPWSASDRCVKFVPALFSLDSHAASTLLLLAPTEPSHGMGNFLRVIQLTLRHRAIFAAAVLCAVGIALLWGVNFGLTKPIVEILFAGKPPHAWADAQVAAAHEGVRAAKRELAGLRANPANASMD